MVRSHPYTVVQPQDNTYGMLLYSRLVLPNAKVQFLVQDDVPSIQANMRLRCGAEVELRCLHPRRRGALQISSGSTYATFDRTPIIVLSF
jgi:hypothetical protein